MKAFKFIVLALLFISVAIAYDYLKNNIVENVTVNTKSEMMTIERAVD